MCSLLRTHLILTFPALLPAHVLSVVFAGGPPSPCQGPPSFAGGPSSFPGGPPSPRGAEMCQKHH